MSSKVDLRWPCMTTPARENAATAKPSAALAVEIALELRSLSLWYGTRRALDASASVVPARRITALIGPSASGKSSLLRCLNRLNDELPECRVEGQVMIGGANIYAKDVVVHELRRRSRHGVPEAESVSAVGVRERRVWPAPARHRRRAASSMRRSNRSANRPHMGRSGVASRRKRARAIARPAATPRDRACTRGRARKSC